MNGEDAKGRRRTLLRLLGRHKALTVIVVMAVVLGAGVGSWTVYLNHQLGDIPRFESDLDRPGRPARVDSAAQNILLVGVDDGQGADLREMLTSGPWQPGIFRSDAIMVLHIEASRSAAQLISIPRDSLVAVDGLGNTKINAAFSEGGPPLLARTVEALTGLYLDHIAVVDFTGFEQITRAIGGVDVYVPETVYDPFRDYTWTAGSHHIEGRTALLYVRMRAGLPRGDLDRVERHQNFMRALLEKVATAGVLANPIRLTSLFTRLSDLLAVDEEWTTGAMRSLALSARNLRPDDIRFVTVAVTGTPTIAGQSVVTLDMGKVRALFDAVSRDRFDDWARQHETTELGPPDEVD